ncbi:hypothetical protein L3X38_009895 [Prunus dulcis]|uniref:Uncharacterized protein n=1 Tax=Prunus dulcis TaxID=3755 RepID=A0AAD4WEE0_PRUDU|nr:hypothetical protein L3X38_009895 [Prunus dulcis]
MWLAHKDFDQVVSQGWNCSYVGNGAQQIRTCCNTFKHQLKTWNRSVFGDMFHKLRITQDNLALIIQEQLAQNPFDLFLLDQDLNTELKLLLEHEEVFYAQNTRANWLQLGDKNTKYFHSQALIRRKRNQFLRIKDLNGLWVEGETLPDAFIQAFKTRFTAEQPPNRHLMSEFLQEIEPCVTNSDNENLLASVSNFELECAIKSIGPLKAPGPYGLQAIFYHKC